MVTVSIWSTLFNRRRLACEPKTGWSSCSKWWSFTHPLPSAGLIFPVCARISSKPCLIYKLHCLPCSKLKPVSAKVAQLAHQRVTWGSRMIPQTSCLSRVFTSINIHAQWFARIPSDCIHSYRSKTYGMQFCWCCCLTCCLKKFSKANVACKMLKIVCFSTLPSPFSF